jgi:DNA-binding transcriptional MerR regulator/quercetin dioxygenase-like cupin family protein
MVVRLGRVTGSGTTSRDGSVTRACGPGDPTDRADGVRIGRAAEIVGVTPATLRRWEAYGLVAPARVAGSRSYAPEDLRRLKQVRRMVREEGLNLAGIRRILPPVVDSATPNHATGDAKHAGSRIRALRRQRGLSLKQLAAQTGVSASYVSLLERAQRAPSVAVLQKLAAALGANLLDVAQDGAREVAGAVVRSEERTRLRLGIPGAMMDTLARSPTDLEPLMFTVAPQAGSGTAYRHEGDEFLYVLAGSLEIVLNETSLHVLKTGDAMTFSSEEPHRWRNPGKEEALILWINTPPTF